MCNYYSRHRPASELQVALGFVDPIPNLEPRYVVRPTDTERVVAIGKDGALHFPAMRPGIVTALAPRRQMLAVAENYERLADEAQAEARNRD